MRAVIQRVKRAAVTINGQTVGSCGQGFLILLGVKKGDVEEDADLLAAKIAKLRIFCDENGKMNLALGDVGGELLVISNFTLCADCRKGNRPDYFGAESPDRAKALYEYFTSQLATLSGCKTETGEFGATMAVDSLNDGPVTLVVDTDQL